MSERRRGSAPGKTLQWSVFSRERPSTLARAGGVARPFAWWLFHVKEILSDGAVEALDRILTHAKMAVIFSLGAFVDGT